MPRHYTERKKYVMPGSGQNDDRRENKALKLDYRATQGKLR